MFVRERGSRHAESWVQWHRRCRGIEAGGGAGAVLVARAALSSIQSHQERGRDNSEGEEDDGARRMMRMTVRMIKIEGG